MEALAWVLVCCSYASLPACAFVREQPDHNRVDIFVSAPLCFFGASLSAGLFVGCSASMNCVGAVLAARRLGAGHKIVTVLCDSGNRGVSRQEKHPHHFLVTTAMQRCYNISVTACSLILVYTKPPVGSSHVM